MEVKPGWQTSEFLGAIGLNGLAEMANWPETLQYIVAGLTALYMICRTAVKIYASQQPELILGNGEKP